MGETESMEIKGKFMTSLVSRLLEIAVSKKLGVPVDIYLNEFESCMISDNVGMHIDMHVTIDREDLSRIIAYLKRS